VKVLWAFLWILPQALATDSCAGQSFGSRAVDLEDPHSYYLCLGFLGHIKNTCKDGYFFDDQTQGCVINNRPTPKTLQAPKKNSDKNEVSITQNVNVDRPVIFNIFGNFNLFASLWGSSENTTSSPPKSSPISHLQLLYGAEEIDPLSSINATSPSPLDDSLGRSTENSILSSEAQIEIDSSSQNSSIGSEPDISTQKTSSSSKKLC